MRVELISKLSDIDKSDWNNLNTYNHPFTSYDFLNSLEVSKSVHSSTGWNPQHIIIKNTNQEIIGVSPNYLKMHSYGEYIFDHSWANAFENAGGQYYPKLICAIPFTPATGPRIMIKPENTDHKKIFELIINTYELIVRDNKLSSAHINFTTDDFNRRLQNNNWIRRTGLQFHWHNNNYKTFDDFLNELKSSKRKAIRNERKKIKNTNLVIEKLTGEQLNDEIWDSFYNFYLNTVDKKWGGAYLTKEFFHLLNDTMKNDILLIIAKQDEKVVAGALNFISKNTLYGRNWGSIVNIPFLHFELCYYQAIEYAIEKNIKIVEAGAQGHHKIQRGYIAKPTYSNHFVLNDSFAKAIKNFTKLEEIEINKQIKFINTENSPYSNI